MKKCPVVSIMVPIYNVEKYIGRCVKSLFDQTYGNIEYILVNDCTPDRSMMIVEEIISEYGFQDKCRIVNHAVNKGISGTRNDCLDQATGDYLLFVDSDDYIETDMVEKLVEAAVTDNADIAGCGYVEEFPDHSVEHPQNYSNDHVEMMKAITMLTIKGVMWKLLIKRNLLMENSIHFIEDNNMVDDYLFCCQVFFYAKTFASVDRCMYHYVQYNPNNYSHKSLWHLESQAVAIRKTETFYKEHGVYELLKDELQKRKFILKLPLILDKKNLNLDAWRKMFPESNMAWKNMDFPLGNRIIFMLAASPFYPLVKILRKIGS